MPESSDAERADCAVVVVGSYVHDHVWTTETFPDTGETRSADGFATGAGGKGFNQAIACHRQGTAVCFIGALGADEAGTAARAFAQGEALECRWLERTDAPTGAASIAVDRAGANRILVHLGANLALDPAFVAAQSDRFAAARVVLVQLESNLDAVRSALDLGSRHGLMRILNPAPAPAHVDARLLSLCDVITPNEHEFAQLLDALAGITLPAHAVATLDDATLHAHCRALGVPTVLITLGSAGCFVSHGEDQRGDRTGRYRIAAEHVQAVDTVGAGDAFNGALAGALHTSPMRAFELAVRHANRVAAMSTEKAGAAPSMPTRAEVLARFGEG